LFTIGSIAFQFAAGLALAVFFRRRFRSDLFGRCSCWRGCCR